MKRVLEAFAFACLAVVLTLTPGCGKQAEKPPGTAAENGSAQPEISPAEAEKILAENTPLLKDADTEKRLAAAAAIGNLRGQGAAAARDLIDMLGNPDEDKRVKDAVKDALGKIGGEKVSLMVDKMSENFDALASYRKQIEAIRQREQEDAEKLSQKDQEIVALKTEKSELRAAKAALETSLAEKETALKAAAEKLAAIESGQESAGKELAELKIKNADLITEIAQLKNKVLLLQTDAETTAQEIKKVRDDLAAAQAAAATKDNAIQALQNKITQLEQKIDALEAKIKELQQGGS